MNLPVPVIFGPTASGKSRLAMALAKELNGEIINADSRQIYRHMPIIAACPSADDYADVPHHLYEFLDPRERFSAGAYAKAAVAVMAEVTARGKRPILVGGTGLYLRTLMEGLSPVPPVPDDIQAAVEAEVAADTAAAYARLQQVDAAWAARIMPGDSQRIARGLAVAQATGTPLSGWQQVAPQREGSHFTYARIGLCPPRAQLHANIETRWKMMLDDGVVEEIRRLKEAGYTTDLGALKGLGIPELYAYLDGTMTLEAAVQLGIIAHRQYAKRQETWLNNQFKPQLLLPAGNVQQVCTFLAA